MTCNSNFRKKEKIPTAIHNFKSYDQHLLIHGVKKFGQNTVKTIPHNTEKFEFNF
jgi:hypothetical protein